MFEKNEKELNNGNCSTPHGTNLVRGSHYNSTTLVPDCQSIDEQHKKELKEKFTEKKKKSCLLVSSFDRLSDDFQLSESDRYSFKRRSESVSNCGTYLEFAKYPDRYSLHRANFCRDRLCPMCSWRRSLKIFGQVSQIMNVIESDYAFIFLTLTIPNCDGEDLSNTIDELSKGWARFIKYNRFSKICKGFFRALEVTYSDRLSNYHPHYHVILAVSKSYFTSHDYISHDEWLSLWRKAMRNQSITQVDVRRVRSKDSMNSGVDVSNVMKSIKSAVAEIAKYAVKDSDYLVINSDRETDFRVYTFSEALYHRRLCAFGGCFKDIQDKLGLDDSEDGDLIHIDGEIRSDVAIQIVKYSWGCGAYKLIEVIDKSPMDDENLLIECDE